MREKVRIGGVVYYKMTLVSVEKWIRDINSKRHPGVDFSKYYAFLESHGLQWLWSEEADEELILPRGTSKFSDAFHPSERGVEKHHILLKAYFPLYERRIENIAQLVREDHYEAHKILHSCNPNCSSFAAAYTKIKHRKDRGWEPDRVSRKANPKDLEHQNFLEMTSATTLSSAERAALESTVLEYLQGFTMPFTGRLGLDLRFLRDAIIKNKQVRLCEHSPLIRFLWRSKHWKAITPFISFLYDDGPQSWLDDRAEREKELGVRIEILKPKRRIGR